MLERTHHPEASTTSLQLTIQRFISESSSISIPYHPSKTSTKTSRKSWIPHVNQDLDGQKDRHPNPLAKKIARKLSLDQHQCCFYSLVYLENNLYGKTILCYIYIYGCVCIMFLVNQSVHYKVTDFPAMCFFGVGHLQKLLCYTPPFSAHVKRRFPKIRVPPNHPKIRQSLSMT